MDAPRARADHASRTSTRARRERRDAMIDVTLDARGVRVITIDNPARGNALASADAVRALARALARDDGARVVVLCGSGASRHFCSGIDLRAAREVFAMDERDVASDPVLAMEACEAPIVGAVHGDCVNAGFELALGCDALVASEDARFVDTHATIGILPSWGLSVKLSRSVGANAARACSVFGRAMDARRAEALGLTCATTKDAASAKAKAMEMAMAVCEMAPGGASAIKRAIHDGLGVDEARAAERRRAFANYRAVAREKFAAFNARRSKL